MSEWQPDRDDLEKRLAELEQDVRAQVDASPKESAVLGEASAEPSRKDALVHPLSTTTKRRARQPKPADTALGRTPVGKDPWS